MIIKGLGGTVLQPGIDYISDNYNLYNTVILTDGYTDSLDLSELNKVLIISTDSNCPIKNKPKKKLKQIIIKE